MNTQRVTVSVRIKRTKQTVRNRGTARVNSDKRQGPKSSDSAYNEIEIRDNLPWPNCDSDGKADDNQQAFINADTRRFKIQTGDMGPPPPLAGPRNNEVSVSSGCP